MASINGVEIKNIKTFKGHEGEPLTQGTVYKDGKKLGFWSEDSWGGPDNFDFNPGELLEPMLRMKSSLSEDIKRLYDVSFFIQDCVTLKETEKTFKKIKKNPALGMYAVFCFGMGGYICHTILGESQVTEDLLNESKKALKKSLSFYSMELSYYDKFFKKDKDFDIQIGIEEEYQEELRKHNEKIAEVERQAQKVREERENLEKKALETKEEMIKERFSFVENGDTIVLTDKTKNTGISFPKDHLETVEKMIRTLLVD